VVGLKLLTIMVRVIITMLQGKEGKWQRGQQKRKAHAGQEEGRQNDEVRVQL
jgi:ribosomal protein S17